MQKIFAGLVVLALAALAAPVNASSTTFDRNLAFITDSLGEQDLSQTAILADGTVMTLGDALATAAARAGDVDLSAVAAGAAPSNADAAGDVWVLEYGTGGCTNTQIAPGSPAMLTPDPQFWLYSGGVGTQSTGHGYYTYILGWTVKAYPLAFNTAGYTAAGNTDFFCIGFSGYHLAFPFVDGVAGFN